MRLNQGVASPNQMAQELKAPVGNVSYHVRVLADLGAIELVGTQPRRGATEHFYAATQRAWFDAADWAVLPLTTRRGIFGDYLREIYSDIASAGDLNGFDDPRAHVSFTPLELDEQGIDEVAALLDRLLQDILDAQAASAGRAVKDGLPLRSTEVVALHFERGRRTKKPRQST